jgi:RHS repeat-associated protein
MRAPALGVSSQGYTYAGMAYANPHAVTQIANGLSTTTFTYDNNGNVTQKTTDGTTTTYVWDYANRLTALGVLGATTTYGYDWAGNRVYQQGTSTTSIYPFKWYSVASSTGSGAKYSTTTEYVFNGDTLLSTVDRQLASGTATGTAKTRYVHPDHLGSTNVVTDENAALVQTLDYYPYGATRISVATSTRERRQFIGQFTDDSSLSYLNARYYDNGRGQFLSEDPVFWNDPKQQNLSDPQSFNTYSYSTDNPITKKDPTGLQCIDCAGGEVGLSLSTQVAYDKAFGPSSPAVYGGDIVAASLYGFAYPWTLVAPEPIAAISAAAGNVTQQGLEYVSGDRTSFDSGQLKSAATVAFGSQLALGNLPLPFISAGSLEKQMATKLQRGLISNVSNPTLAKIMVNQAPGAFAGNFATNYVQTKFNNANLSRFNLGTAASLSTALSMSTPSLGTTIAFAQAAIQLARSVIAARTTSSSH